MTISRMQIKEGTMATRAELVKIAKKYVGCKQGSKKHKDLVDTFNKVRPHGEVGNYSCYWCAIAYTAFLIKAGFTRENAPMSYNCGRLIEDAKALGVWRENDAYIPEEGDGIIYYWNDSGKGDCRSGASHVGTVEKVDKKKKKFTVIEGNKGTTHACGRREMSFNGRYIRGFITLKFGKDAKTQKKEKKASEEAKGTTWKTGKEYTVVVKAGLNVRKGPGTSHEKIGAIAMGTKVVPKDVSGNWLKIEYKGGTGWICGQEKGEMYVK